MKKIIVLIVIAFYGCDFDEQSIIKKPFYIGVHNGDGWSETFNTVNCDSFKMITPFECRAYYNGTEMIIKGKMLAPQSR